MKHQNQNVPSRRWVLFAVFFLLLCANVSIGVVYKFIEDFSTNQYKDALNTTVLWDTVGGEIKLYPYAPTFTGNYVTGNVVRSVAVASDYAVIANWTSGVYFIDVSDPASPGLLGSYNTPGEARGVSVSGNYVFVADRSQGFHILDAGNPVSPVLLGSYDTDGSAFDVVVRGDFAYVADANAGLCIIDISTPSAPSLADYYDTPGTARDVDVSGNYAFIADDFTNGLLVVDITDPTNPVLAGSYTLTGNAQGVTVDGDHVFLANGGAGLSIIDVTDPTTPALLGTYNTNGTANAVFVSGDYAYVADGSNGLEVIEITNVASPQRKGYLDTPGDAIGIFVSGTQAYVADNVEGLRIIDIADPVLPVLSAGGYDIGSSILDANVEGDVAYILDGFDGGIISLDITDPKNPTLLGSYSVDGNAREMQISGNYAYVADFDSGLRVFDISNPTSPAQVALFPGDMVSDIVVSGDYAYITEWSPGILKVLDIGDPATPTLIGSYSTVDNAGSIAIGGDYAYIAECFGPYEIIDITDPTTPTAIGAYSVSDCTVELQVDGNYLYVANRNAGLRVIDVSDPLNPVVLDTYSTSMNSYDVAVRGDLAFVCDYTNGFKVFDVSDPTNLSLLDVNDDCLNAYQIDIAGDYAFVASGLGGLKIFQIFGPGSVYGTAQSLVFFDSDSTVYSVKLLTIQNDSIRWEVSADGGTNWQDVLPTGRWVDLIYPGSELLWRSNHIRIDKDINPSCSMLEVNWLTGDPLIESIVDIPNDQGKQVRVTWRRSGYDFVGSPTPITEYAIYRRIDPTLSAPLNAGEPGNDGVCAENSLKARISLVGERSMFLYPPGDWDFITSVPARAELSYNVVVPTLADSTILEGMYYTTFFVSAMTDTPGVYFDSSPDSGYSLDNLDPGTPSGFSIAYNTGSGNQLSWDICLDEDFKMFRIYRGDNPDFLPDPGNLVHATIDTSWADMVSGGWQYYYKVTSVDFSGNESDAAIAGTVTSMKNPSSPSCYALYQNVPNPFNPVTAISYDVPGRGGLVTLKIFDVNGRLVRTLVDRFQKAGRKTVMWDGKDARGRRVASGIYFCRLGAPDYVKTIKMALIQ